MKNKALLFKALDSIHKEPERFDMGYYAIDGLSGLSPSELIVNPTCSTTLCLGGWVLHHHAQGDARKIGGRGYAYQALTALGVEHATEEWDHLEDIMWIEKPLKPDSPGDLVAQLEEYGILAYGEYTYV